MRHFSHLSPELGLFAQTPVEFHRHSDRAILAPALGATLYVPADRPELPRLVGQAFDRGVRSMVICLEDGIPDAALTAAEDLLPTQLAQLDDDRSPLLFVRVRDPEHLTRVSHKLGAQIERLTGFVFPKCQPGNAEAFLDAALGAARAHGVRLLSMPILETPDLAWFETRRRTLGTLFELFESRRDEILAVRFGATDISGLFGLRRPAGLSIYDIEVVRSLIGDVVNQFRRMGSSHVVTGPVWEYFHIDERIFKPDLRQTPFRERAAQPVREALLNVALDGLIREVELDKANGLLGKTVIHPTHVPVVHALLAVTHEEYSDALAISRSGGGVSASLYVNKMNEMRPHALWAERTLLRATAFGVTAPERTFVDLLAAQGWNQP